MPVPNQLKWVLVITGAGICGVGSSVLWVSQGSYISAVADSHNKSELFGLFWGLIQSG